jgi:hypothetical protein
MNSADRLKLVCRLRSQDAEVKLTCIRLARCGLPTRPKAPQIGPKLHPTPTALPPLIGAVPCGSASKKVVPLTGLEPVTPALRRLVTDLLSALKMQSNCAAGTSFLSATQPHPSLA